MKEPEDRLIRMQFATRLRLCRLSQRLTQKELQEKLSALDERIKKGAISHYEQSVSIPDIVRLAKIAYVLRVSVDYLLGLTEDPRRK